MFYKSLKQTSVSLLTILTLILFGCKTLISNPKTNKAQDIEKTIQGLLPKIMPAMVKVGGNSDNQFFESGVIITPNGFILTSAHTVSFGNIGTKKKVTLSDSTVYYAEIRAMNRFNDYALLKITEAGNWPYVSLQRNSNKLALNEALIMLGFPEDNPVPIPRIGFFKGITDRDYLKTSNLMMPGDSGGPLFDLNGYVVGVTSFVGKSDALIDNNYYAKIDDLINHYGTLTHDDNFSLEINNNERQIGQNKIAIHPVTDKNKYTIPNGKQGLSALIDNKIQNQKKQSVVKIKSSFNNSRVTIYGTVISREGHIISKSSRVSNQDLFFYIKDIPFKLDVIKRDKTNDLVLLKASNIKDLIPVTFKKEASVKTGQLIGTLNPENNIIKSGIVGAEPQIIPTLEDGAFQGLALKHPNSVVVDKVSPNSLSEKAGFRVNDSLVKIDTTNIKGMVSQIKKAVFHKANQKVTVLVHRNGALKTINVELTRSNTIENLAKFHTAYNVQISKRRDNFPNAFTHDIPIEPMECGTPVVDINGLVIGIIIARNRRVKSYAVPIEYAIKTMLSQ